MAIERTASAPVSGRTDALEAYRGIAALSIVVFHAYQHSRAGETYIYQSSWLHILLRNLDSGVAIFLALSGFLIFLPFVRAFLGQGPIQSARGFLVRRAIRIVPLYYAAILIVWSLRFTGGSEQWLDLLEHLTFTQIYDSRHIFWTIGPAWSLAVEVVFYLGVALSAPLLQLLSCRLNSLRKRVSLLVGFCAFLFGLSLAYKGWAFYITQTPETAYAVYYGPLAKLDLFALGMLLAIAVAVLPPRPERRPDPALAALAGVGIFLTAFLLRERSAFAGLYFHTLCGLGAVFLLASTLLRAGRRASSRTAPHPALLFLGLISYSLYIWHEPILIFLSQRGILSFQSAAAFPFSTLLLLTVVVFVGTASYFVIEYPTRYLRDLFTRDGRLAERYSQN